ncbi:MAG: S41 family peptidase, partial [Planctomycetota bacterium]
IRLYERRAIIQKVFPDSPAQEAGLKAGDFILAADGTDLSEVETLKKVSKALQGREGSTAHLTLERDGERIEVEVTRAVIHRSVVEHRLLAPGLGYVRMVDFPDQVSGDLTAALAALREQAPELRGLVLDVRWNQGGFLDEAVRVADLFLADGIIVRTRSRHPSDDRVYRAEPGGPAEALPMVVLVNAFSASAAEVVAGALQDHNRARLVGTTTYGKGAVNKRFSLPDGSGLLLTTGQYYLPGGRQIEGKGLQPNREVPPPSREQVKATPPGAEPPDPQRDAALRLLRRQLGEPQSP